MPDIIITPSSGIIDFFPASARVGRIEGSGNTINIVNPSGFVAVSGSGLSVNTSSPNATFHAYSAVSGATLLNIEGTNGSLFSVVDNLSGTLMSVNNNAGLPVFEVFSDDRVVAGRFGQNDFIMTSGGNIGIGTGVPSSKFHVLGTSTFNGDVSSTGSFIAGSGSAALPSFEFINDVDTGLFSPATNTFGVSTSGVERLRVDSIGNIGIGTTSPQVLLHVNGQAYLQSLNLTGGTANRILATDTNNNVVFLNTSTYPTLTELSYVKGATSSIQTQLDTKAPLSSPTFSGIPAVPTASSGTNTTQIASTAFVRTEISNLVSSAPATLDTLNELATALGNDANFSTTVTTNLGGKANLSGATFTGSVSGPSGNFTSLKVNSVDVSAVGHTHTSSNITDFNSSVSGLLPLIANSGDNRVLTSTGGSVGVNAESNLTFNGNLLSVTGSGSFSNNVTASGFVRSGGTSSQFLKADGSIDSTAYTTNVGTVTSVAALTLGTTGTDVTSTVATNTTTPVITLNIPTASASNRGVLSSGDWTTFNNKQATLTNPVTGTGASNHIAYWSSSSSIAHDSNQLVWDATNNRLGIGTASPTHSLHVAGDVLATGSFIAGSGSAGNPSFEFVGDTDTGMFAPATNTIALATSGIERLRISNVGNVGINTTNFNFSDIDNNNLTAAVSVSGNLLIQNAINFYTPNEANQYQRGRITSAGDAIFNTLGVGEKADAFGGAVVMNTNGLVVNNGGGLGGSACQLLGDYGAIIENTLIVNSNANGNATVGIGTATPSEALHVVGTSLFANEVKIGSLGNDPGILNVYTNDASDASAQINLKNGGSTNRLSFSVNDDMGESVITSTSDTLYIINNAANSIMNIASDTINLNGSVSINSTPLSTSQLINIINGGNLYLWSNFR